MDTYSLIIIKFVLGMLCLILQINLLGKGNLAPTSAIDQVQNYVLGGIIGGIIYKVDYRMKLATQLVVNKKRHSA